MKNDTVDIFITGPFCNFKTGKSTWVAVFGDNGSAWTLKAQFVKGYISTLLTKVKASNISNSHADSYYDINIRKYEYGKESLWKRKDQRKTFKRLSFAFTCETIKEKSGKHGLTESIHFLFMSMKKRDNNPVGPLIVDYLKEHSSSLYDYLLKKTTTKRRSQKKLQRILTSISVRASYFIGMIVSITGWWIMTLSAYWKSILDIHPGLMSQNCKGVFVTRSMTRVWLFLNGTLNKKDTIVLRQNFSLIAVW